MIWLLRWFTIRNISAWPPRYGAISARSLNRIAAVGRANRENRKPVTSACDMSATSASNVMTAFAVTPTGAICPYPIVPNVSTEKKNAYRNRPPKSSGAAPASALGPQSR